MSDINIIDEIWKQNRNPDKIALISDLDEKITYGQLKYSVEDIASLLKPQCIALVVMNNDLGSVIFYLACLSAGTVPILLDKEITRSELQQYLIKYEPEYILNIAANISLMEEERRYIKIKTIYRHMVYQIDMRVPKTILPQLALLLPTSGTTYVSKLVRISKENLLDNTFNICKELQIEENDLAVSSLPFSYTYGLSILNTHLLKHATILVSDKSVLRKSFWEFVNKYKATSFAGVPYTYELLEMSGHMKKENSIRVYTQAGGHLSITLQRNFWEYCTKTNKRFYVMYGQTEATARISVLQMEDFWNKIGSVGRVISGGTVHIDKSIDDILNEGEIVYAGRNVCLGYCDELNDLARGDDNNGILYTKDIGYIDKDGYIYITGRKADFVKLYGRRISLYNIERMLETEYGIKAIVSFVENQITIVLESKYKQEIPNIEKKLYRQLHLASRDIVIRTVKQFKRTYNGKMKR